MLHRFVALKAYLSEKIQTKQCEYYNPDRKINFSVEDSPMVGLVSYAEELESKRNFYESQYYLD